MPKCPECKVEIDSLIVDYTNSGRMRLDSAGQVLESGPIGPNEPDSYHCVDCFATLTTSQEEAEYFLKTGKLEQDEAIREAELRRYVRNGMFR